MISSYESIFSLKSVYILAVQYMITRITYLSVLFSLFTLVSCNDSRKMNHSNHLHTNALINETSPYLLQHAHNPVNWLPWSEAAFEKARHEDKLVLISIGYSACHWCHVMERESFEDSLTAEFMNDNFINIKVDREERPDVDQVYMTAVQLMTGSGGWPLNCITLPDGRPIFGGTYFSKADWNQTLESILQLRTDNPEKLEEYATNLTEGIQQAELVDKSTEDELNSSELLHRVTEDWKNYWDTKKGGPNRAPKFPLPNNFSYLLQYAHLTGDSSVQKYVELTLDQMAAGGIYDHLGGGFARYSTDENWKVPHFEKMLYDNAQLISLYSEAFSATGKTRYKDVVLETIEFVETELHHKSGGYYSALDADSEGEEGKFYVWKKEELKAKLTPEEYELAESYFHLDQKGKWDGNYILLTSEEKLKEFQTREEIGALKALKDKLLLIRNTRIRPGLDDKILCSWNAMYISSIAKAGAFLDKPNLVEKAKSELNHLLNTFRTPDGALFHTSKNGVSKINGYLEDYAFTIQALIDVYEVTFKEDLLLVAQELSLFTLDHFHDSESGMFYFTSDEDAPLIARKLELTDNVIPSSNSVIAHNLFKLGKLLDNSLFTSSAVQMAKTISLYMDYGQSYSNWLSLHLFYEYPFYEVAFTGENLRELSREFSLNYIPNKIIVGASEESEIPLLEGKISDMGTIYVCQNKTCNLPVNTVDEALLQIK